MQPRSSRLGALGQQFLQHGEETRAAFSANAAEHAVFLIELKTFRDDVAKRIRASRQMRVLREDVIERIARLDEAQEETDLHIGELRDEAGGLRGRVDDLHRRVDDPAARPAAS